MAFIPAIIGAASAAVTGVASWLGSTALGSTLLQFGLGLAAKYLQAKLTPKPKAQATQLEVTYGADLARSVLLGTTATAGHHIYRSAHGRGNRKIQDVYVLSHFRIGGISRVRYKGKWCNLVNYKEPEGYEVEGTDGAVCVRWKLGTMDQAADAFLVSQANPASRWTANHRLAGVAYAVVYTKLEPDDLTAPAELLFEVQGAPLYDWRKDSSVGGSGAHRWNNQATWEPSDNPAVMAFNLERGFFNGTELMVGKGVPASRLPLGEWTLAANICDELVGGKKRYRAALIATAGQGATHAGNMEPLMEAMAASWLEVAAGEFPIAGANQAVVATFTDADLYAEKDRRFLVKRARSELVNFVAGTFPDPEAFYEAKPFKAKQDATARAADGERLAVSIPFEAVPFVECVDRLAEITLRASRYQANGEVCLRPKFLGLKQGQWVRWNSARFGDRKFQIVSKRLGAIGPDAPRAVYLTLQEVGDGIFDPTAFPTVPVVPTPPGTPNYQTELAGFSLTPFIVQDAGGAKRPAIRASWAAPEDPTVTGVDFEYRPVGQPAAVLFDTAPAASLQKLLIAGLTSNAPWEVHYRLRTVPARITAWTLWEQTTTLDARIGRADIYDGIMDLTALGPELQDIKDWIDRDLGAEVTTNAQAIATETSARAQGLTQEAQTRGEALLVEATERLAQVGSLATRFRSTADSLNQIALTIADQDFAGFLQVQQVRVEMDLRDGAMRAAYTDAITVATGPSSAIATRLTTLEASTSTLGAAISTETTARVSGDSALAQQITLLSAGSAAQFDWSAIWYFDGGLEGWGGNGTPTYAGGFVRPAVHVSDPYLTSPAGLNTDGTRYGQVLARIRKVGAPTWEGQLWWAAAADTTWDAARRATIAEPSFDANGIGVVTFTPAWSGTTVDRIRFDLSSASTASAYYEADWIAVGRPSPGASSAALLQEQTVRAQQYQATTESLTALNATVNSLSGTAQGNVAALQSLSGTVQAQGETITVHTQQITALTASVGDKADAFAVSTLQADVQALGSGVVNRADALRLLRGRVDLLGLMAADEAFAGLQQRDQALQATAQASQQFSQSIEAVNGRVDLNAKAITEVSAQLPGFASAAGLNALTVRVTATETTASSQGEAITSLQNTINDGTTGLASRASSSTVATLQSQVNTVQTLAGGKSSLFRQGATPTAIAANDQWIRTDDNNRLYVATAPGTGNWVLSDDQRIPALVTATTSQGSAITGINNTLVGLNDNLVGQSNALSALTGRVTSAEGTLTSQGSAVTSLQNTINDPNTGLGSKASASALSTLTTRVTDVEGVNTAQATAITQVQATLGDVSASANIKFDVQAGPSGYSSRIGLRARVGGSGDFRAASLFLDVPADPAAKTRIVMDAQQIVLVDSSNPANIAQPFVFQDGVAMMNLARINQITAGSFNINNRFMVASDGAVTIQNASSGARLVVTSTLISVFDASNVLRVRMGMW